MHFLNLHVCPVVCRKDLFLAPYSFSYILMICHKLSNVIVLFMLTIHALYVNTKLLMKLKNKKDFESICDWFVNNKLSIHFGDDKTKSILFATKIKIKGQKTKFKILRYTNQRAFQSKIFRMHAR